MSIDATSRAPVTHGAGKPAVDVVTRFDQLGLPEALLRSIADAGHDAPSHVQAACIPPLLAGRDLFAHADAGSGRTLAFVLPLLATLDLPSRQPQVLVITASDEFAIHVAEAFHQAARHLPDFHVLPIYHQASTLQLRQYERGVQVIVGVPRRIMFYVENYDLDLGSIRTVVIDEADRMLLGGFSADIAAIFERTAQPCQKAIFAGTLSRELLLLVREHLHGPLFLPGTPPGITVPAVRQHYWQISPYAKLSALTRLFEIEPGFDAALVFVHSNAAAIDLTDKLNARGYASATLPGDTTPDAAGRINQKLRDHSIDIVVATDLAATALVPRRIGHIISYDAPRDAPTYAGRLRHFAEDARRPTSILLIEPREAGLLHGLERAMQLPIAALALPERFR